MLKFRNIDVTPDDPVEIWGVEGILAAIERGDIRHWRRILSSVRKDLSGYVEQQLREALSITDSSRKVVFERWLEDVHEDTRETAIKKTRRLIRELHLPQTVIAKRLGTSRSRVNLWAAGRALPDAENLQKLQQLKERRELLLWGRPLG